MEAARPLFSHRRYWAHRFGVAPVLPMSRAEMDALGWDACDVIVVTGDAFVDHPSFGAALVGRLLEAHGFRVGVIAQPDWKSAEPFRALGRPALFFGVTGGNMDSMVNRYTSDRKVRNDDAYTAGGEPAKRPDRASVVYAQRCREAFKDVPIVLGGIEASLRRIAHYDYWSEKVRRSVLLDAKADLLLYGNAERALVEVAHHLAARRPLTELTSLRGAAFLRRGLPEGFVALDSSEVDAPGPVEPPPDPYASEEERLARKALREGDRPTLLTLRRKALRHPRERTVVRMPSYEQVKDDPVLYAHASRILHLESNPGNARALVQQHGDADVWINPPPVPLTTAEMDRLFELPFSRRPHPAYGDRKIPAYEMIKLSVTALRGCFGGCAFCSITEHEGRVIQSRSEASLLREIERIRDLTPGFTGVISDIGGPTANMYRLACKDPAIQSACRKPSCVYPDVCENLGTDHGPLVRLYRKARAVPGVKKILIASGLRYDLAVRSPEYVKELARHHVGGYLKVAPEHVAEGPLSKMMKPGVGTFDRFKALFDRFSREAGKDQYLIPYFIAAHPGTTDEDMLELALWLKRHGYRADQVQAFLPSPMASATAMYHTGKNPLEAVEREGGEAVVVPKGQRARTLHKAFLRYHDPKNWPLLREALVRMGRRDLIGPGPQHLVPLRDPPACGRSKRSSGMANTRKGPPQRGTALTQHTGLPPREDGGRPERPKKKRAARSSRTPRGRA
jgi:uncharacterized radical SAM protein YgiQ